jgi:hypothetical protein
MTGNSRVSGSIYFLGRYRPAYFEASNLYDLTDSMIAAVRDIKDANLKAWLFARISIGRAKIDSHCTSWSADHCDRGVSFAARPHDPWLDSITAKLPPCPGLNYGAAI